MSTKRKAEEHRNKRAKLIEDARAIADKAKAEERDLSGEESEQIDRMLAEEKQELEKAEKIEADIQRMADLEAREAALASDPAHQRQADQRPGDGGGDRGGAPAKDVRARNDRLIRSYLLGGIAGMDAEDRAAMNQLRTEVPAEVRQMATDPGSAGGFLIPQDSSLMAVIVEHLKYYGGMRNMVERGGGLITSLTGGDLPIPTSDNVTMGYQIDENAPAPNDDPDVGSVNLGGYIYTSGMIKASVPFLQDSLTDAEAWLGGIMGDRIGRIFNSKQTTGDGNNTPHGVVPAVVAGGNILPAGAVGTISSDDVIKLEHQVNAAYRRLPGVGYMMNDQTLLAVKLLKDSEGRPLFQAGLAAGAPDTLNGRSYEINDDMADIGASAVSMLFGAFGRYRIREIAGMSMMRLVERYAENWQVGFVAFTRMDADLADPGNKGIGALQHPAS